MNNIPSISTANTFNGVKYSSGYINESINLHLLTVFCCKSPVESAMAVLQVFQAVAFLGLLCHGILSVEAKTPVRPQLSSSFTAKVSVISLDYNVKTNVIMYSSVEEMKQLMIADHGNMFDTDIADYSLLVMDSTSMTCDVYLTTKPFSFCVSDYGIYCDESAFYYWDWLKNATYNCSMEFDGSMVDVWTFEDDDMELYIELGVLSGNPVYLFDAYNRAVIIFNSYENCAPPTSVFNVPQNCKGQERKKQKMQKHGASSILHRSGFLTKSFKTKF